MPPAGFEPAIPASEWPQTHALDRTTTGIGIVCLYSAKLKPPAGISVTAACNPVVWCCTATDMTRSAVLWNTFGKHPDSFIAFEMLCSSSQLRHESFMLHEKGFPFVSNFRHFRGTADGSTYLAPVIHRTSTGFLLEQWTVVTRHPIKQVPVPCGAFHP